MHGLAPGVQHSRLSFWLLYNCEATSGYAAQLNDVGDKMHMAQCKLDRADALAEKEIDLAIAQSEFAHAQAEQLLSIKLETASVYTMYYLHA